MREVQIERNTGETQIQLKLCLDGTGNSDVKVDNGFFEHMLTAFARHGGFDLTVSCIGDTDVDCHHTVEDIGIVLGTAFKSALEKSDKAIVRYGNSRIPMDESLAWCDLDICNRPYLVFNAEFKADSVGDFDTQMVEEFMRAFAVNAGITLHIGAYGKNDHHKIEAMFKALAYALKAAVRVRDGEVMSTKGVL